MIIFEGNFLNLFALPINCNGNKKGNITLKPSTQNAGTCVQK